LVDRDGLLVRDPEIGPKLGVDPPFLAFGTAVTVAPTVAACLGLPGGLLLLLLG
jgi:hypothetical protein